LQILRQHNLSLTNPALPEIGKTAKAASHSIFIICIGNLVPMHAIGLVQK
jgi:hypothetical protein